MFFIGIDRKSAQSLSHQIYSEIREKILQGQLKGGHRLPASRTLSEELRVSRNVVVSAYDQLYAEGYLETKQGDGSFVAEGLHSLPENKDLLTPLLAPIPPHDPLRV